MDNLIFSLNATLPVFFVIFLGWLLVRLNILKDGFVSATNDLTFKVLFPVLLFRDVASIDLRSAFNINFFLFCVAATVLSFAAVWLGAELFIKDKTIIGSFVQGAFRGSAAVLGVAFAENIYGSAGMVPVMIIASVPLYNMFSVIVLTFRGREPMKFDRAALIRVIKNVVTNPLIIGIVLGIPFAVVGASFPTVVGKTINSVSSCATPLALLMVGAGFDGSAALKKLRPTVAASLIKTVVLPAVIMPAAVWCGFRGADLVAILIMSGAPTTVATYIMARGMKNDETVASGVVVLTTLFSALTITAIIFILKVLGLI